MTELFEKSIRVLELPQLLERLSQKAVSEAAKERALRLTPSTDADDVRRLQDETDAARALIGLRGSPSFSGVTDVRDDFIGPVIGAHTGCGTLGLFFVGTER